MNSAREIRALRTSLAEAGDAKIVQIVAMVDAMPFRGAADGLVAPLRARLAKLRPPRRVNFTRLLFTPIDPLIVSPQVWRRGSLSVPRSVLVPLANAMRDWLPEKAAEVDAQARLDSITDLRLTELAASIWPRAATALDATPVPPGWAEETGLADKDYHPLATAVAAVLNVAVEIHAISLLHETVSEEAIRTILGRTASRGPDALSAVVAVLLARLPGSGRIVALATEAAGSNPPRAVDSAVDHTLDLLQAAVDDDGAISASMGQATQDAARIVGLLQEMEASAATRPERKKRIDRARRGADALCRGRFEQALQDELMDKLDTLPSEPDDLAVVALETSARGLRQLEAQGRRLGSGDRYDTLLRGSLAQFQQSSSPLTLADRVRLIEILVGADEALSLLEKSETEAATRNQAAAPSKT